MTRLLAPWDPLAAGLAAALLAALLTPPIVAYEPAWEVAAALGFGACGAAIPAFRLAPPRGVAATPYRLSTHRAAGHAMLALAAGHVAVMVAADPFVLDYMGWMMPLHVLPGAFGLAALALAVATREPALRLPPRLGGPRLHAWAGVAAGVLVAAHALAASTKLIAAWREALLAAVFAALLAPAVASLARRRRRSSTGVARRPHRATAADIAALLALIGALAALLAVTPTLLSRARG